jgi:hypothetical protein
VRRPPALLAGRQPVINQMTAAGYINKKPETQFVPSVRDFSIWRHSVSACPGKHEEDSFSK